MTDIIQEQTDNIVEEVTEEVKKYKKRRRKPRIVNGVCGSGDDMHTNLLNNVRLPKDHPALSIYGYQELTANSLALFLCEYGNTLDENTYKTLEWIRDNFNCLGAFCFFLGKNPKYAYPIELLEHLDVSIQEWQKELPDCLDFIINSDRRLILLDRVRIEIRILETHYVRWYKVCKGEIDKPEGDIGHMYKVINRLSTYIFNLCRIEAKRAKLPEKHWSGKVEEFDAFFEEEYEETINELKSLSNN